MIRLIYGLDVMKIPHAEFASRWHVLPLEIWDQEVERRGLFLRSDRVAHRHFFRFGRLGSDLRLQISRLAD